MPSKPNKWGYKVFVLCGSDGFAYDFEVYTGQENMPSKRLIDEPDIGAAANVVVRLSLSIPKNKNHKLYFDNYYTAIELMIHLPKMGIPAIGTVRKN